MAAKNDITGDSIQTRGTSEAFRNNYDLIFGKKKKTEAEKFDEAVMKNEYYGDDNGAPSTKEDQG